MKSISKVYTEAEQKLLEWSKCVAIANAKGSSSINISKHALEHQNSQYFDVWESCKSKPLLKDNNNNVAVETLRSNSKNIPSKQTTMRKTILPIIGLIDDSDIEENEGFFKSLYISNISNIVKIKKKIEFYTLQLSLIEISKSLNEDGLIIINWEFYDKIGKVSKTGKYIIILSKNSISGHPILFGVSKIIKTALCRGGTVGVYVKYLSLMESSIKFDKSCTRNVQAVFRIFRKYLSEMISGSTKFILGNRIISKKETYVHSDSASEHKTLYTKSTSMKPDLPVFKNLTSNIDNWFEWEYGNLDDISDWAESSFIICDMLIDDIKQCLQNNGRLYVDDFNKSIVNKQLETNQFVYLIFREHSYNDDEPKHVFGIAKVVGVFIENISLQFFCLSRAQYVTHPWCDEDAFTSGQVFNIKEDIRILLDMYKMSLKKERAKPIFTDIYPWNCCSPLYAENSGHPSNGVLNDKKACGNGVNKVTYGNDGMQSNDSSPSNTREIPSARNDGVVSKQQQSLCKETHSSQRSPNKNKSRHTLESPNKNTSRHAPESPNKNTFRHTSPEQRSKKQASCVVSNLLNLKASAKLLTTDTWSQIEIKNLEVMKHDCNARNEFYIAMTTIPELKKSIKSGKLAISERNVQNFGGSSRNKRYIFLKAKLNSQSTVPVVGIAKFDRISEIELSTNGHGYIAPISLLSLSMPWFEFSELFNRKYGDGSDVPYNVAQKYISQYIVALKQGNADVILDYVYPWCTIPPTSAKFVANISSIKNVPTNQSKKTVKSVAVDEDDVDDLGKHLKNSINDPPKFTFADINKDLIKHEVENNHSQSFIHSENILNMKLDQDHARKIHPVSNASHAFTGPRQGFNLVKNGPSKRGGGRGKLLMMQAANFRQKTSWN